MKGEKYLSARPGVNGFSFANLGLFTGFGDGIISAVYSLILLEIWKTPEMVGVYSSAYFAFGLIVQIFFGEFMRMASKVRLFYFAMFSIFACYAMLSFSVRPATFLVLDFFTEIPLILIMTLLPLFMADFADRGGIARMNGRYHFWLNAGGLLAPIIAMQIVGLLTMPDGGPNYRIAFFASGLMYLLGWWIFKHYRIVQEDKKIAKISPRRTIKGVLRSFRAYFRRADLVKAYAVNFGYYAMKQLRLLYWPILVIEAGFSKETLGLVLTLGILPYVILSEPVGWIARKGGPRATKIMLTLAIALFVLCAAAMMFANGNAMFAVFFVMQASGAVQEALHDMVFFDVAKKEDRGRFYSIFNTSTNLPKFITPLIGAAFIVATGMTKAIWIAAGIFGILTIFVLLSGRKNAKLVEKKG